MADFDKVLGAETAARAVRSDLKRELGRHDEGADLNRALELSKNGACALASRGNLKRTIGQDGEAILAQVMRRAALGRV